MHRIYATGISNGAQLSFRLACKAPDLIAAIATIAGSYPPFDDCDDDRPIPLIAFHGTAEPESNPARSKPGRAIQRTL